MSKIVKTIGGDRLGAGKQRKVALRNYERSTHNLSEIFQSSVGPGILYPCYLNVQLNGDSWEFDVKTALRTLPTVGPVFGNFKLQVDFFSIPLRLYNARLHNNPINVGLHMQNIKLPVASWSVYSKVEGESVDDYVQRTKTNPSSLCHYLLDSGFGWNTSAETIVRVLPAVKYLAYYDIFKNYYANKQEDDFYFISNDVFTDYTHSCFLSVSSYNSETQVVTSLWNRSTSSAWPRITVSEGDPAYWDIYLVVFNQPGPASLAWSVDKLYYKEGSSTPVPISDVSDYVMCNEVLDEHTLLALGARHGMDKAYHIVFGNHHEFSGNIILSQANAFSREMALVSHSLSSIDDLRDAILMTSKDSVFNLSEWSVENSFSPFDFFGETYSVDSKDYPFYNLPCQGLLVKTYQSDIYNAFLNKDFIEGVEGISAITKIDTTNGLEMDTLLMAEKVYNMLCQIAVSGGTWEDYQEAVWGEKAIRRAETPIYLGGLSSVITFDEVVSNSAATIDGDSQPLGTLGGRGRECNVKGGRVVVKTREPSLIMAIASITPLDIMYCQGNTWINNIYSPDDLHKPALDQIGYQDLIGEEMLWTDTSFDANGDPVRRSYGKVPAWLNYMTAVNHSHGDFANDEGKSYMSVGRNYEVDSDGSIADFTTYIDPKKFNYMFAYSDIDAQNFQLQIGFRVTARRKMSAKVIPNL